MRYFSTNRQSDAVGFRDAVLRGQPEDGGLYFPAIIPSIAPDVLERLDRLDNAEIALHMICPFVGEEIDLGSLYRICVETVDFDFPVVEVTPGIFALELFHGPTLAFKDIGARFISRCLGHFAVDGQKKTVVVVATSGDTGGAIADGFYNVEGVEVVILYPSGKVSRVQELQLTTLGGNITAIEVAGDFDACQALAKRALADADLSTKAQITSANSINVARWLPQQFYYAFALKYFPHAYPVISVPSGNFGNLAAGMLARRSGLPLGKFIAACNVNDVVPRYLETAEYEPRPTQATLSNAMDVGAPSNFVRLMEIASGDVNRLRDGLVAVSISDAETARTMKSVWESSGYILDPHGAVGYRALGDYLEMSGEPVGIFLETAHPVKFDSVSEIIGVSPELPGHVAAMMDKEKTSIKIENDYNAVREIILSRV